MIYVSKYILHRPGIVRRVIAYRINVRDAFSQGTFLVFHRREITSGHFCIDELAETNANEMTGCIAFRLAPPAVTVPALFQVRNSRRCHWPSQFEELPVFAPPGHNSSSKVMVMVP